MGTHHDGYSIERINELFDAYRDNLVDVAAREQIIRGLTWAFEHPSMLLDAEPDAVEKILLKAAIDVGSVLFSDERLSDELVDRFLASLPPMLETVAPIFEDENRIYLTTIWYEVAAYTQLGRSIPQRPHRIDWLVSALARQSASSQTILRLAALHGLRYLMEHDTARELVEAMVADREFVVSYAARLVLLGQRI